MDDEGLRKHLEVIISSKKAPGEAKVNLEESIEKYRRLIHKMAQKYVRSRVEFDDLVQEAMHGLILACREFDPSRSDNFHTYAIYRMKGKMYEYCIGNENPIYVPTHVAKAASYVKQMKKLFDREPAFSGDSSLIKEIIITETHPEEDKLPGNAKKDLSELKRKLGNIARNSNMRYKDLAIKAVESLSMMVSDDVLSKFPKETELVEEFVSNSELREQLRESLGEKRYTVLSMRASGWNLREIAEKLEKLGYVNKQGKQITRQAVKAILDETTEAVRKMRIFNK